MNFTQIGQILSRSQKILAKVIENELQTTVNVCKY